MKTKTQKYLLEKLLDAVCSNNAEFLEAYYKRGLKDGMALMCSVLQEK